MWLVGIILKIVNRLTRQYNCPPRELNIGRRDQLPLKRFAKSIRYSRDPKGTQKYVSNWSRYKWSMWDTNGWLHMITVTSVSYTSLTKYNIINPRYPDRQFYIYQRYCFFCFVFLCSCSSGSVTNNFYHNSEAFREWDLPENHNRLCPRTTEWLKLEWSIWRYIHHVQKPLNNPKDECYNNISG